MALCSNCRDDWCRCCSQGVTAVLYLEGICLHLHQKVVVGGTAIHLEKLYLTEMCILLHGIHHLPCLLDMPDVRHIPLPTSQVCMTAWQDTQGIAYITQHLRHVEMLTAARQLPAERMDWPF